MIRGIGKTPKQLLYENQHLTDSAPSRVNEEEYGVGGDSDNEEDKDQDQVVLHPIKCPLTELQQNRFEENVQSLSLSEVEDLRGTINRFEAAVESLREFLEEEEDD